MEPKHPAPRWQEKGKWRAPAAMRKAVAEILELHLGMSNRTTFALAPRVIRVEQIVADMGLNGVFCRFRFVAIPNWPRAPRVKKATVSGKFAAAQFRHKKHSKAALVLECLVRASN
jgi:hypothetical protein